MRTTLIHQTSIVAFLAFTVAGLPVDLPAQTPVPVAARTPVTVRQSEQTTDRSAPQRWTQPATAITHPSTTISNPPAAANAGIAATPVGTGTPIEADPPIEAGTESIIDADFPLFQTSSDERSMSEAGGKKGIAGPAVTVTSSLAVVLGLFAAMIWLTRRFGSRSISQGALPKEVFESLGTTPLDARTRVTMLRCGSRVVVVAQTASGIQPLMEITDPDEVRQLSATCLGDSNQSFLDAMRSIEKEPVQPGFMDQPNQPPAPQRKRSRLFATA